MAAETVSERAGKRDAHDGPQRQGAAQIIYIHIHRDYSKSPISGVNTIHTHTEIYVSETHTLADAERRRGWIEFGYVPFSNVPPTHTDVTNRGATLKQT